MQSPPRGEYDARVARARSLMRDRQIDALIVTDQSHYSYFTGHAVAKWMRSRPSIFILPLDGDPAVIMWSGPSMFARLYDRPFPTWVEDRRIYPEVPFDRSERVDWGVADVLRDRALSGGRVAIEMGRETWLGIPLCDFELLRDTLPRVGWVDSGPILWGCRMIKSEWEIDCMRTACEIGGRAWKQCFDDLHIGISTVDVQRRILSGYADGGADLTSAPPMVLGATGPGGTFRKGDILYLDGGCSYAGYGMDFARRAVFGEPDERQLSEHDGMWKILFEIIDMMKPGVPVSEVFEFSQRRLAEHPEWRNYSDHPSKRIGHGMGMENEPPSICAYDDTILAEGMVLTPEPKIETVEGLLNPEEHVVIRADGCEILSKTPGWELHVVNK